MRCWMGVLVVAALMLPAPAVWAATYVMDADHSSVEFRIRHLFSYVKGSFNQFEGTFEYEPDKPGSWKASAVVQAVSIDTRVEKRDNHLRSKDFFEVETYPTITFTSTKVTDATPVGAKLEGLLTMHGVEKPIVLDLSIHGTGKDPQGNARAGFTATTTIDRKEFGLNWNKAVEADRWLIGEQVEVSIEVEGVLKQ